MENALLINWPEECVYLAELCRAVAGCTEIEKARETTRRAWYFLGNTSERERWRKNPKYHNQKNRALRQELIHGDRFLFAIYSEWRVEFESERANQTVLIKGTLADKIRSNPITICSELAAMIAAVAGYSEARCLEQTKKKILFELRDSTH